MDNEVRYLHDILAILHHCSTSAPFKEAIPFGDEAEVDRYV